MHHRVLACLLVCLLALSLSGCLFISRGPEAGADPLPSVAPQGLPGHAEKVWTDATGARTAAINLTSETFIDLAAKANPAVVNIFSTKNVRTAVGDPLGLFRVRTPNLDFSAQALGTGFFISPDGFMLTNAHVVVGADEVKVLIWQENEVKDAKVIGLDQRCDLALLKVAVDHNLPYLKMADSDAVAVGEMVIAIGNPFGLQHSLTNGLISAKHRRLHEGAQSRYEDYLQTSAQINPGNSGGPLLNLRGEVVGVNTATVQGGQGIGFAVPSNLAKEVMPHLVRTGLVRRAFVGLQLADLQPSLATVMPSYGAQVTAITDNSPATKAGLRRNDVITEINGGRVYDATACSRTLSLLIVGRPAKLTVYRNREKIELTLTPEQAPPETNRR